eukprot:CAMPEP_0198648148 /NCGR_PEP_ID=MMETSP1467-20131203/3287_1 /TAXON_ID=1462469 /ORGANISM="unid. sp., Strain CCMP2135" /LENGTH=43 /DNA_ID= /DNA_START= /DNA_END= /DNA_ORIENTATION=
MPPKKTPSTPQSPTDENKTKELDDLKAQTKELLAKIASIQKSA